MISQGKSNLFKCERFCIDFGDMCCLENYIKLIQRYLEYILIFTLDHKIAIFCDIITNVTFQDVHTAGILNFWGNI